MSGRRTACTPELTKEIADLITQGLSNKDACAIVGISQTSYHNWINRAELELERLKESKTRLRKREKPFIEFLEAIKKAIPDRKKELINRIARHSHQYWQAAAWLLERLHPDEFGRRDRMDITSGDKPIKGYAIVSPEDWPENDEQ